MSILKAGRPSKNREEALEKLKDKEEIVKLNFNVTKSFSKALKVFALERDITVKELILRSLNTYMSK